MTPPVEEHLEQGIGIEAKLGEENVKAYTELLAEEINEKTEFSLRVICWHHYSKELTRVLVKKKQTDLEGGRTCSSSFWPEQEQPAGWRQSQSNDQWSDW